MKMVCGYFKFSNRHKSAFKLRSAVFKSSSFSFAKQIATPILSLLLAADLTACGTKTNSIPDAPKVEVAKKTPPKTLPENNPSEAKPKAKDPSDKLNEDKALTELRSTAAKKLIDLHEKLSKKNLSSILDNAAANIQVDEIKNLKVEIEKALTKINLNNSRRSISIANIIYDNEIQAYSGTALFIAMALKVLSNRQWSENHVVVIYTTLNGVEHVLPGFIQKNGDSTQLFGVEMLNESNEPINFGNTNDLTLNLRVIDPLVWIDFEALSSELQTGEKAAELVQQTHQLLKIPLNAGASFFETRASVSLGHNPLFFGQESEDSIIARVPQTTLSEYGRSQSATNKKGSDSSNDLNPVLSPQELESSNERMRSTNTCIRAAEVFSRGRWQSVSFEIASIYNSRDKSQLSDSTTEAKIKEKNKQFVFLKPIFSQMEERKKLKLTGLMMDGKKRSIVFEMQKKQNGSCRIFSERKSSVETDTSAALSGSLEITIPMISAKSTEQEYSFYFEQASEEFIAKGEFVFKK